MYLALVTFYFRPLSVIVSFNTKLKDVLKNFGGRLIGVNDNRKPSSGRPKGGRGRLIEVLFTVLYWQKFRDFGNWPLNGWPLNRGLTVVQNIQK